MDSNRELDVIRDHFGIFAQSGRTTTTKPYGMAAYCLFTCYILHRVDAYWSLRGETRHLDCGGIYVLALKLLKHAQMMADLPGWEWFERWSAMYSPDTFMDMMLDALNHYPTASVAQIDQPR